MLILLFKKPLHSLIGRIKRLKGPWAELEMSEKIEEVTEALTEAGAPEEDKRDVIYELVDGENVIDGNVIQTFRTSINPEKVSKGQAFITQVDIKGVLHNGFFTNLVNGLDVKYRRWFPDQNTIPGGGHTNPGNINGYVDMKTHKYSTPTTDMPPGQYQISVRLYSHREPGKRGRTFLREEVHELTIE